MLHCIKKLQRIKAWGQSDMPARVWFNKVLSWVLGILLASALLVIILDPCTRYREPVLYPPYYKNAHVQLPGIVRHYDYDTLVLGSSMAQNFALSDFNELFAENVIKATAAGTRAADLRIFLDFALKSHPDTLKHVYYIFDLWAFSVPVHEYAHPVSFDVFYRDTYWKDYQYWWNWDVWRKYMLLPFKARFRSRKDKEYTNKDMMFSWRHRRATWGLNAIRNAMRDSRQRFSFTGKEASVINSLEYNLLPYISQHTNVKFTLVFPPYSLIFWWQLQQSGELDSFLQCKEKVVERLSAISNLTIYDFQAAEEIIANYDLYKDSTHFRPEINQWMLKQILNEKYQANNSDSRGNSEKIRKLCEEQEDYLNKCFQPSS